MIKKNYKGYFDELHDILFKLREFCLAGQRLGYTYDEICSLNYKEICVLMTHINYLQDNLLKLKGGKEK